jgi:hypothetical protein
MKTPQAIANVAIIDELKKFMNESINITGRREKYFLSATKDFTRNRILTFKTLALLLVNSLKRSLSIELQNFFERFSQGISCSKQAFSAQRSKLKPIFFHDWNHVLVENFYQHYGDQSKRWKGFKLWAMDGSSVPLPDREALREAYGGVQNQHKEIVTPMSRICVLYDVLNQIAVTGMLHPYFVSEEKVSMRCLENHVDESVLLLFDRGYPGYWLMYLLLKKKTNFVMRVQRNGNNAVKSFIDSDETDITIDFYPPYSSIREFQRQGC